ncbi:hypothetical protein C8R43DRAFT_34305 [Mycena crocata]|nr:hypothetical protein C8R43DRAFT_34305 [Mycena crocata]
MKTRILRVLDIALLLHGPRCCFICSLLFLLRVLLHAHGRGILQETRDTHHGWTNRGQDMDGMVGQDVGRDGWTSREREGYQSHMCTSGRGCPER